MALSCGTQFIKYLLFIFNVLVFLFGVLITGFGIYFIVEAKNSLSSQAIGVPAFILTLGLLLFLIGFLGCCGACKEHTCMLKTFAAIIIILLILQIVAGILVFVYRSKFVEVVGAGIAAQISKVDSLSEKEQKDLRRALNALQKKLHCCGGKGPTDWGISAPPSCCEGEKSPCSEPYNLLLGGVITGFGIYFVVEAEKDIYLFDVGIPALFLTMGLVLLLFAAIIIILLIAEIVAGALVFVYRGRFVNLVAYGLASQISQLKNFNTTQYEDIREAINVFQEKLQCCGGYNASDWGTPFPSSCCAGNPAQCTSPYEQGCAQALYDYINKESVSVGIILFIMAVLQLGAIIAAFYLASSAREYEKI
ncbi:unnamed protein product [Dibothriocephalus latus]|uniref:Uncharacterized protein n=1 Tax=Dibothriocephalus latus TaxID=60516 RepID=A0A3P6NZH8_DIBLA|nr:unnamed protein product [Dibothriocephalus latus]